jgi:phage-related protein
MIWKFWRVLQTTKLITSIYRWRQKSEKKSMGFSADRDIIIEGGRKGANETL